MSQAMNDLRGSLVALVTPMTASGAIDWAALDGLVDWHLESGTHGIVPVGTTGESATLTHAEQKQVIEAVVRRGEWPRAGGRRYRCQRDGRGHRTHSGGAWRRCRLLSVGDAVLQQADSGGPLPALLRHCRGRESADGSLQCAAAHGVRHAGYDRGPVVCLSIRLSGSKRRVVIPVASPRSRHWCLTTLSCCPARTRRRLLWRVTEPSGRFR